MQSARRARRGSKVRSFTTLSALGGYLARSNAVNRQLKLYLKAVTRFGRRQDAVTSPLVKISSKILHVFFLIFLAISRRFQEFYNAINTLKERNFVWQCLYRTDDSQKKASDTLICTQNLPKLWNESFIKAFNILKEH